MVSEVGARFAPVISKMAQNAIIYEDDTAFGISPHQVCIIYFLLQSS